MPKRKPVQYTGSIIFPEGTPVTSLPITEHGIQIEAEMWMRCFKEHRRQEATKAASET